jgi:3-oxoacyl-[acyl-carrier-protein] synthase-1
MRSDELRRGRDVVITGVGICCHLGDDLSTIERLLREGRALPFSPYHEGAAYQARCRWIGRYPGKLPADGDRRLSRFMGRAARLAHRAALAALAQSGIERHDLAVVAGSGTGDVSTVCEIHERLRSSGSLRRVSPVAIPRMMASTVSANLTAALGMTGPSFAVSAACAGGALNLLIAAELIERGHVDAALAGGAEAADPIFHAGFEAMRACNSDPNDGPDRACRPYAADRAGFIFGEGAGMLVLEASDHASARGAPILGIVRGYGMSSDGTGEMVAPAADGAGPLLAMRRAIDHAGATPEAIDYVNTHGTATPLGDVAEIRALERLVGGRRVAYSSTKGYTGHTISAAGAIEAILTCAMLRGGWIAPSVHAEPLDAALLGYPPITRPTSRPLTLALSNSLGFGGTNVCLVLGRE